MHELYLAASSSDSGIDWPAALVIVASMAFSAAILALFFWYTK